MQAGLLDERIDLYKRIIERNDFGEEKEKFELYYSTRCKVEHINGTKSIENDEIVSMYTKRFHVRYYVNLSEVNRIKFQNHYYRVLSIEEMRHWNEKIIIAEMINE